MRDPESVTTSTPSDPSQRPSRFSGGGCPRATWLVVVGAVASIVLHVVWMSPWTVLPLLLDAALLWAVFGMRISVATLRG